MRNVFWIGLIAVAGLTLFGYTLAQADETAYAPTWEPPSLSEVSSALEGLSFDRFIDVSYKQYLLRFPENLTHYGMAGSLGVRNDRLNDYSETYLAETRAIESLINDQLKSYDRDSLTVTQQLTYDVCAWYWDDLVRGHEFADLDYLVTHYYITSKDWATYDLLTVVHPLSREWDVDDYMARLSQVDVQLDQLVSALSSKAEKGIVAPDLILAQATSNLTGLVYASATSHPFYTTLVEKTTSIPGFSSSERTEVLEDARDIISERVLPAYRRLYDKLNELRQIAPQAIGYGEQPNGLAYYDYALRHQNQADFTAQEIHQMGLEQVARLQTQIYETAVQAGYSEELTISQIYSQAALDGGSFSGAAIVDAYEQILEQAKLDVAEVFNRLPRSTVVVVPDATGGYYRASSGARPAEFAAPASGTQPYYSMPTLTYHETIPGHHLQIGLAAELSLPLIRNIEVFLGFTEGWALYAERLAWELGWYDDDVYGDLGRLSDEMMRAVRLVVDTGIHAMGWTYNEAVNYFVANTGKTLSYARYQVQRYIVWPGQSTSYMTGFLKILELRDRLQQAQGDDFVLADFHSLVIESGSMPLEILERRVQQVIDATASE